MKIRTGGAADVPATLDLLDAAVAWLVSLGRPGQWGTEPYSSLPHGPGRVHRYATEYLMRIAETDDGQVAGVCVLGNGPADGVPVTDEPEVFVRLLVTDRALKGGGVGAALINDAKAEARRRGVRLVRVDCYAGDDQALVAQYERLGFTRAAAFTVEREGKPPWPGQVLELRV
ncbi:GNAT family N-acetyltransferase [Streptomyces sp. A7024]|uniref:GNAT family N-acetyltransferase n=1 Tax=Streptomyces coryli TaxID=1128680 RepID=A0A6G4U5P1_9ACTN|nr:GNAT family N-acetyltransferase [Streptomyces coryli]NGN67555.1 GNAT family N-acetyltransferase [Streptomyces coryli]